MKKCCYCEEKVPKKERNWYRTPCCIMDDNNLVCNDCYKILKEENNERNRF